MTFEWGEPEQLKSSRKRLSVKIYFRISDQIRSYAHCFSWDYPDWLSERAQYRTEPTLRIHYPLKPLPLSWLHMLEIIGLWLFVECSGQKSTNIPEIHKTTKLKAGRFIWQKKSSIWFWGVCVLHVIRHAHIETLTIAIVYYMLDTTGLRFEQLQQISSLPSHTCLPLIQGTLTSQQVAIYMETLS